MDTGLTPPAAPVARLSKDVAAGLIGHDLLVERLMIALLADGHLLIEGPPGLAKTRAVKRLSGRIEGGFARIQCTPDLMPSDILGTQIFRPDSGRIEFLPGPIFHALVLVDEINRAPPKVQSALLEAMAERQVTVAGATRPLPDPFLLIATQNSIEHEGTFPLPEAQLDRFLLHVDLALPGPEAERAILDLVETELRAVAAGAGTGSGAGSGTATGAGADPAPAPTLGPRLSLADLARARAATAAVYLAPALKDFIIRLVTASRQRDTGPLAGLVEHAISPRGTLALAACTRARALLAGRDHGLPEDVEALAADTLAHRLVPSWSATAEGLGARDLVARLLAAVRPW